MTWSSAQIALTQLHPRPGWVEHDPEEIGQSAVSTCREMGASAAGPIAAASPTSLGSALWERATGRPVHNAIVWQDRRQRCASTGAQKDWRKSSLSALGSLSTYVSAAKIRCLLDSVPGLCQRACAGEIAFGAIDSFLCVVLWRLSGGRRHATDATNTAPTMLFDIWQFAWDAELFGIPRALLPDILDTDADYGTTTPDLLGNAIPVAGMAGDQRAAAIG